MSKKLPPEAGSAMGDDDADIPIAAQVDVTGCDKIKCGICGHKATDDSPLHGLKHKAVYGSYWPWNRYNNKKDDDGVVISKAHYGKRCAICRNTYSMLGYPEKYGPIHDFVTLIAKPENFHVSRDFVRATTELIAGLNDEAEDGVRVRLKNTKDLKKRLQSIFEVEEHTDMLEDEMDFVTKEAWDEKLDGKYDPSKEVVKKFKGRATYTHGTFLVSAHHMLRSRSLAVLMNICSTASWPVPVFSCAVSFVLLGSF